MKIQNLENRKLLFSFLLLFFVFFFSINTISAALPDNIADGVNFKTQQQNQSVSLVFSPQNSTQCNVSYITLPDGTFTNVNLTTTSNGQVFNRTIAAGNFSQLGRTCFGLICTNSQDTGSLCIDVTPTGKANITTFLFIFLIIIALTFALGVSTRNNWVMMLASILTLFFGFFIIIYGIDIFKDTTTTWAVGLIVWALAIIGIFKSAEGQLAEGGWR